jgi:hypothetical protein
LGYCCTCSMHGVDVPLHGQLDLLVEVIAE